MVIAEAIELDPGAVVALLLLALLVLLTSAAVVGLLGTWIGVAIARRTAPPGTRRGAAGGGRLRCWLGGVAATLGSWILLFAVAAGSIDAAGGAFTVVAGLPLSIAWGWWWERSRQQALLAPHDGDAPPPPPSDVDP